MNESLEAERYREIGAEIHALASKARTSCAVSSGLIGAAAVIGWTSGESDILNLRWTFLCLGVFFGLRWLALAIETNRARAELSLHLARCQLLARGVNHDSGIK
jgi:hypothetical protein